PRCLLQIVLATLEDVKLSAINVNFYQFARGMADMKFVKLNVVGIFFSTSKFFQYLNSAWINIIVAQIRSQGRCCQIVRFYCDNATDVWKPSKQNAKFGLLQHR